MNAVYPFQKSPRCSATSKRTRRPCMAPAVTGWTVCRFHGARGGGPKGERNGMYRHGLNTKEAVKERRLSRTFFDNRAQCYARNSNDGDVDHAGCPALLLSCLDVQGWTRSRLAFCLTRRRSCPEPRNRGHADVVRSGEVFQRRAATTAETDMVIGSRPARLIFGSTKIPLKTLGGLARPRAVAAARRKATPSKKDVGFSNAPALERKRAAA